MHAVRGSTEERNKVLMRVDLPNPLRPFQKEREFFTNKMRSKFRCVAFGRNEMDDDGASGVVWNATIREVVVDIAASWGMSYFLTSSGRVYATGTNYNVQLCLGDRDYRTIPTLLSTVTTYLGIAHDNNFSLLDENVTVSTVTASDSNVYLLITNGMVLACGDNIHGQLGIRINDEETAPLTASTYRRNRESGQHRIGFLLRR